MKYHFFIIGLGQIGCSLALALRKSKVAAAIYGKDKQYKKVYSQVLDEYLDDIEAGVRQSDIIILSTPIKEIQQLITEIAPILEEKKILLDTGSTKGEIVREMKKYPKKILIGGHPMAGTVRAGEKAWQAELFSGKPFFLCFPHHYSKQGKPVIEKILNKIGAVPVEIEPAHHDFLAAVTSHLPYIISIILFSIYLKHYRRNKVVDYFISTGFLGSTRLALTPSRVGSDIILTNKNNIIKNIKKIIHELDRFQEQMETDEIFRIIELINREAEKRRKIYENAVF
jgi:prephenate dehydrogenase